MQQIYDFCFTIQAEEPDIFLMNSDILTSWILEHQWLDSLIKISFVSNFKHRNMHNFVELPSYGLLFSYSMVLKALLTQCMLE